MIKSILICVLVVLVSAKFHHRPSHNYWYTKGKAAANTGVPYVDAAWNYCDLKCLYFENYYPNKDFVVLEFEGAIYEPDFAACYVKSGSNYALWNTVATNSFFEENCGGDSEDYTQNSKYKIKTKSGEGVGANLE